ncbi:hypothetical protein BO94DRAFT_588964 [Aspergillus sclerotioniger CBS 115572]|uniref:Uncharacterized protein n=1 Tax=Aspergillus sclerotioniger CBS 115572 TaxID=1450535 RepID=A0A317VSV5_9EURO|nr:hypothetical protein BO94DRAFT_588964 [Aspergillus sclerotioniger CBS 115572]PWY76107.1 hypothetical protein BO94DRAFT_588964 [Aspergillus sclerotioniger CBS 115572]
MGVQSQTAESALLYNPTSLPFRVKSPRCCIGLFGPQSAQEVSLAAMGLLQMKTRDNRCSSGMHRRNDTSIPLVGARKGLPISTSNSSLQHLSALSTHLHSPVPPPPRPLSAYRGRALVPLKAKLIDPEPTFLLAPADESTAPPLQPSTVSVVGVGLLQAQEEASQSPSSGLAHWRTHYASDSTWSGH